MIGYRGCYRYVKEPDVFALELTALARVRERNPNLHMMIPFVRTSGSSRSACHWWTPARWAASVGCTAG